MGSDCPNHPTPNTTTAEYLVIPAVIMYVRHKANRDGGTTLNDVVPSDEIPSVMAYDYDGDLALIDIKEDKVIKKWKGHDDGPIYTIILFHGRNWFATGDDSGEIKIWDDKGELLTTLKLKGEEHPISALALTRDNHFLASSGENRPIVLWDLRPLLNSKPVQR